MEVNSMAIETYFEKKTNEMKNYLNSKSKQSKKE